MEPIYLTLSLFLSLLLLPLVLSVYYSVIFSLDWVYTVYCIVYTFERNILALLPTLTRHVVIPAKTEC